MERYAIYYAPAPDSALARWAAGWIGWDPAEGAPVDRQDVMGLDRDEAARAVAFPRRYGFHGTLKAPFRLAEGRSEAELRGALHALAKKRRPAVAGPLKLNRLARFLALTPSGEQDAIAALAEACVTELDGFRSPLTPEDLARRRKADLSPRQDTLLERWGYPYVLDQFRFHLTLTGPLDVDALDRLERVLKTETAPFSAQPFSIESLCLFGDPGGGRSFQVLDRVALGA
ncbi:MAG: DUF1045 domain-containing protein [Alphaproteobacteria bacterium]|nr:DUF1045 domain-containing protein [Alphaproteobacteria bacterium]